ncbi:unnamed protein product [Toxocara canis]|uniref:RNase_Zc3h12a domain-containing protein n=1 Tax=Toxocara canis TaxID=6265 RepID=A0A183U9M0_TOXCA|nr:unnamed protein product [Toxocara canis]
MSSVFCDTVLPEHLCHKTGSEAQHITIWSHVRPDEENKKLSVRGVTIALWYFISRGHQAQALMPFCFKTYPNKSDNWNELMALFRLNLIEFTPGQHTF